MYPMLDLQKLRITKEEGIALQRRNDWTWDERFTKLADAQFQKLAWGMWDALVLEAERVGHPVSWVVFLGDMGADLNAMGIQRPEERA